MTIVANNSITVSNVNDGTITHTAYANSADGTDGFTTDYKSAVGLDILNVTNWAKNTSMSNSTYKFVSNTDSSFKVTGKGTGGYEVLSKSFPAKIGDKLRFTVRYTNRLAFGLYNNYGLQFVTSGAYTESVTSTSKIVLPNAITGSTEYQLEYTATTSNVWMQLNFGGVADSAQVDFDIKIEVENLTNPVKYAYMGTYSDYTVIDSTVPTDFKWIRILGADGADGKDGVAGKDGKGITGTAITYQASTNGTTAPTGTWSASVPAVDKGSFLWTRTIWTYTDNTTETGYAVAYMGTNGNDGTNGVAGKDGVGINSTTITYAGSTSGTTAPTSGWTSTVPTVAAGSYLWTKTVWAYTDNTSETGYSVAMMGVKGQPGANAPTITNVQDQIYLSTSNTVQSGGSWEILIPAWSSGKYYWSRVATTFSDSTTTYSTPVLDEALNQVATNQIKVTQLTQDLDGFKATVSNTYLSKSDASGTYADKVSVTSQINQSATQVTQNIQSWTNGQLSSYSTIQSTDSSIASAVADKADKTQITQLSDSINLKVSKGDVVSQINVEAGQILFNSNKLVLNANTTEIAGDAFIRGDMIVDGSINAEKIVANNLSAISSNIGSIQNDFTLADGTTGTLHIGSSEYRIDSQVLLYDYLFKENIFFNPDGLSFSFDGDTASNSGYGNYRKSGSDFYLQNNQMASYTVSGIRMSNEFAEYSIQIGDANNKLNFVSKNGQGFEFNGPVTDNSEWQWLSNDHYAKYKKSFGYVSIYYDCSRTSVGNIWLGDLPVGCRPPLGSIMTIAKAWATSATNDRNLQINWDGGGSVNILNAVANQKYASMYTFKL